MHYCCMVFTKEFPSQAVLEKVLKPFNSEEVYGQPEENIVYPAFTWDWWQVGGRYEGKLKLKVEESDEKYRWNYYENNPRNGRLFRSALLDEMKKGAKAAAPYLLFHEEDWFGTMGLRDGFIRVDGALCSDIINLYEESCYCAVECNGEAFSRASWDGHNWNQNDDFDNQLKKIKDECSDCYVCIVDLHD